MADILPLIETLENRWMRAWTGGDVKTLKSLTARNFRLVIGSKPSVLLDAKSWLDAAASRFPCRAYRFGDIYARDVGGVVVFATQLELEASIDGHDWSGRMWVTDFGKRPGCGAAGGWSSGSCPGRKGISRFPPRSGRCSFGAGRHGKPSN